MTPDLVTELFRQGCWAALALAGPLLLVSALVGVAIGLFQAVTQIHETTIVFVPKVVLGALVTLLIGQWQWAVVVRFAGRLLSDLATAAR